MTLRHLSIRTQEEYVGLINDEPCQIPGVTKTNGS